MNLIHQLIWNEASKELSIIYNLMISSIPRCGKPSGKESSRQGRNGVSILGYRSNTNTKIDLHAILKQTRDKKFLPHVHGWCYR